MMHLVVGSHVAGSVDDTDLALEGLVIVFHVDVVYRIRCERRRLERNDVGVASQRTGRNSLGQ